MSLGSNIKKRRYELNISQQELANLMGYKSRSTISKIESDENDLTQGKIKKLAKVLDTTYEDLIVGNKRVTSSNNNVIPNKKGKNRNKNIAIILAGGKSSRNQQNIPNQFINILGKPVILYCLEAYQQHPLIDDIYIVCLNGWEKIVSAYSEEYEITKIKGIIPSGSCGILSVKNAVDLLSSVYTDNDIFIFQESTRPLVNSDIISKLLHSCTNKGSATICQTMKDYVQFNTSFSKPKYIDRYSIVDLQSPEAYKMNIIVSFFEEVNKTQHILNESCCALLLYNLGHKINFIEIETNNPKIIRQEDIPVITALIKRT